MSDADTKAIEAVLEGLVREGQVAEAEPGPDGKRRWYLTDKGKTYVETLLKTRPSAKEFFDELLGSRH